MNNNIFQECFKVYSKKHLDDFQKATQTLLF